MYADTITKSMQKTMDETNYRREKQLAFNEKHAIKPTPLNKGVDQVFAHETQKAEDIQHAAEPDMEYLTTDQIQNLIRKTRKAMETAAKELDFIEAARLRDRMRSYQDQLKKNHSS